MSSNLKPENYGVRYRITNDFGDVVVRERWFASSQKRWNFITQQKDSNPNWKGVKATFDGVWEEILS